MQRLYFINIFASAFVCFMNPRKAEYYAWSYHTILNINLFSPPRWWRGSQYSSDFLVFIAVTYYSVCNVFLDTVAQVKYFQHIHALHQEATQIDDTVLDSVKDKHMFWF